MRLRRPPVWLVTVLLVSILISVLAVAVVFWEGFSTGIDHLEDRADVVRNLGLVVGGIVALAIAIWRSKAAQDQVTVSERDRLDRRFRSGVELLSEKEVVSRLAGIRMLGQLAKLEPELFRDDVTRVLCEFARNPTAIEPDDRETQIALPRFLEDEDNDDEIADDDLLAAFNESIREEIEAAIRIVSDCNSASKSDRDRTPLTINLKGLALYDANFNDVNLSGANLEGARLIRADFSGANLSGARLSLTHLRAANLSEADLIGTILSFSDLRHAQFDWTNMANAELDHAYLDSIDIRHSNFSGVLLYRGPVAGRESDDDIEAAIADTVAIGLTQEVVDQMWAMPNDPPLVRGIVDAKTGEPISWRGGTALPHQYTSWPRS